MERLSDSDSDDEDTYRRLSSVVLRPAITSLPSIGDDNDTDGGDSSSDTEVVFSNINWATQESAGLLFDQEVTSSGTSRLAADANVPSSSKARQLGAHGGTGSAAPALPSPHAAPALPSPHAAPALPSPHAAPDEPATSQDIIPTASGNTSGLKAVSPLVTATRPLIPPSSTESADEGGSVRPVRSEDPNEAYEGRGWLAGVAGRLANMAERRRAYSAATDAEQVADAARHAAALRQHRQQQQPQFTQQENTQVVVVTGGASAGDTVPAGVAAALAVAEVEQQRQYQREREEVERLILRDFHEALRAAESEPPLVAPTGLSLESTVAGLGLEDLDALIARLTAGTVDLRPADNSRLAALTAVGGSDGSRSSWVMQPLPAAESLWSDDEEAAPEVQRRRGVPESGRHWEAQPGKAVTEVELPQAVEVFIAAPSLATGAMATTAAAATAAATPNLPPHIAAPTAVGEGPILSAAQLPGPLPMKFKFFAGPGGLTSTGPQLPIPPQEPSAGGVAGGGINSGGGPLVQDLRHSIAEAEQRNSQEAAAVEAQRRSQAKAAAAKRRLLAVSDSISADGSSDEEDGTTVVRKVRPVPPAPALPALVADPGPGPTALPSRSAPPSAVQAALPVPPREPLKSVNPTTAATERPLESGGGAPTAVTSTARCTSVGTDSTDLRPASRSVFVCTTERIEEEEERAQDIRNYLKARAEAAAAEQQRRKIEEDTVVMTSATVVEERRWPEPPAAVAERIAVLAERQTTTKVAEVSTVTVTEAPKPVKRRAVATFAGGNDDDSVVVSGSGESSSNSSGDGNNPLAANGSLIGALNSPPPALPNGASTCNTGAPDVAAWAFAACSTEGDEDLVAAPAPSSVSDVGTERGARMAAAGTFILFSSEPPSDSPKISIKNISICNSSDIPSPSELTGMNGLEAASSSLGGGRNDHANSESAQTQPEFSRVIAGVAAEADACPVPANGAAASHTTTSHSISSPTVLTDVVRPSQLQLPGQLNPDSGATAVAHVSPVAPLLTAASSASPMAAPQAKSPAARAVQGAPADLCRVPAWLPHASCFTLLLTSPSNLTSLEVGAVIEWLLLRAAGTPHPQTPELPSFSVVGARLLAVPPSWPLLPTAAAEAATRAAPQPQAGGAVDVRVLAIACVPRGGVNADVYSHELPATAAEDAAAAAAGATRISDALAAVPWTAVLPVGHESLDSGGARAQNLENLSVNSRNRGTLGGWVSTQAGVQGVFNPLRLRAHAFSQHQVRSSSTGSAVSPSASAASGHTAAATAAAVSVDGPGISTFVSLVTAGGLQNPHLLRHLIFRAACLGLTLRGLQIVYSTEEATAAIVSATPHRPLAYTGSTLLALSGHNDALRRWQATLGPPDPRLACRTDPASLHALYGDIARHITCSYDHATAARELSVLFGANIAGDSQLLSSPSSSLSPSPSPRHQNLNMKQHPPLGTSSPPYKGSAAGTETASVASVGSIVASGTPQTQWLALPAASAEQQASALCRLHQLLWCGYSLRGLLLMRLPGDPCPTPPDLVFEVSKEEATEQLPLMLATLRSQPQTGLVLDGAATTDAARPLLLPPEALSSRLAPADVHSLPQPYIAEQLLIAAVGDAALDSNVDADGLSSIQHPGGGGADSSGTGSTALHLHHGEDGIAVVALQARPIHTAALLLAAVTAHATGAGVVSGGKAARESPSPDRLELVACRYLRQVPSDVANCLTVLHGNQSTTSGVLAGSGAASSGGGGAGGGVTGRGPHRLVISQPALLAVFHGPSAQTRIARWLAAALHVFHGPLDQATIGSDAPAGHSAWESLLNHLRESMPPAASSALALPLVALSSSQATGKRALAYAFSPAHIFLDAGMHDGLHRPPLPAPFESSASPVAVVASLAAASTPLFCLLAGPEPLPAVIALDFAALHRNLLPRLLKQLWREGYVLHAAVTIRVQAGSAAATAMPCLVAKPAVLLHVSRSNAIQHLRGLAAALTAPPAISGAGGNDSGGGGGGGGLHTCDTWRDAVSVVGEVWPQPTQPIESCVQLTASSQGLGGAAGCVLAGRSGTGASARRLLRPEGARLLQLTAMVITPSRLGSVDDAPALDWPRLSDALEALHSEGFRLAAIRAVAATPRDMSDLGRVSCRISSSQQYAIHASAAAATATAAASTARGVHSQVASPLPCNLILLALARDSAVTSLQVLLDEAGRAESEGMRQGAGQSLGNGPASGVLSALTGRGPGRREAVAALAMVAACISVAHSPAAAEQQIAAVFEDVFGAGGVPLLQ